MVPGGVMRHDDGQGNELVTDAGHLMVMNAGSGFEHAEKTLEDDPPLRMLQIFVRPAAIQLAPEIQHAALPEARPNAWRDLVGADGDDAPFHVRNRIGISDIALERDATVALPRHDSRDTVFFVFDGVVEVDGVPFGESQSGLVLAPGTVTLKAVTPARAVAFVIDPSATVTRAGTVGR